MHRHGLSKSKLTAFAQCPKRLWLQVHRPGAAEYDDGAEGRFAAGHAVGEEACRQCSAHHDGAGILVEAEPTLATALATTATLIKSGHVAPIYEATFEHCGVLVRCDVLEPDGDGGWTMAEVKSSTRAKDYHRADLATQLWVARGAGVSVGRAVVRHIDTGFVLEREGDLVGLFADIDLTDDPSDELSAVPALVADARATLAGSEPNAPPGAHCSDPFACEFQAYCQSALPPGPEWPVEVLPNGVGKKWRAAGIADVFAVDAAQLRGNAARVYTATITGSPVHDPVGARAAMAGWAYPRTWLDFETIAHVIPRWLGTRPYQQVPFQFTAVVERRNGGETLHEFLSLDGTDPRRACAEALCRLPKNGSVIAYNAGFERSVIEKLAAAFPDLRSALKHLAGRVVDLLPVTRNHWYHRDQRGSWSIKAVLPTIAPHLDYANLEVKDGGAAQDAWSEAVGDGCSPRRRAELDAALRSYCGRDVEAMRVVARALSG